MEENKMTNTEVLQTEESVIMQAVTEKGKKKKEKIPRVKWKELSPEMKKKKRKKYIWIGIGAVILFFFINIINIHTCIFYIFF